MEKKKKKKGLREPEHMSVIQVHAKVKVGAWAACSALTMDHRAGGAVMELQIHGCRGGRGTTGSANPLRW